MPSHLKPKREKSSRQRLRQYLLNGANAYDKLAHPRLNHNETVKVSLGMAVIHYDIDEAKSVFLVDAWMRMRCGLLKYRRRNLA